MRRYKRYKMDVVIRYEDPDDGDTSEKVFKCDVTAPNEFLARRAALERAWGQQMVVSHFLTIQQTSV